MKNIEKLLKQAEVKWLKILFHYCREQFEKVHLPSHNHAHHLRVWCNAREIITNISDMGIEISPSFYEGIIIAVFFHDTGMAYTLTENHGYISAKICREFFYKRAFTPPAGIELILDAIEKHDDKKYINTQDFKQEINTSDILPILNISDDLDAFGLTGAYRYAEIYLLRGADPASLPDRIIENLDRRFYHFSSSFQGVPRLVEYHKERYMQARSFYTSLDSQDEDLQLGPAVVIRLIHEEIIGNKRTLDDFYKQITQITENEYAFEFFSRLWKEEERYLQLFPDL